MKQKLNKDVLEAYSFKKVEGKSKDRIQVFTKSNINIILSDDGSLYYKIWVLITCLKPMQIS